MKTSFLMAAGMALLLSACAPGTRPPHAPKPKAPPLPPAPPHGAILKLPVEGPHTLYRV